MKISDSKDVIRVLKVAGACCALTLAAPACATEQQPEVTLTNAQIMETYDRVTILEMMNQIFYDLTQYGEDRNHIDEHFTEDAVMIVNGIELVGREQIRAAYVGRQNENVGPGMTLNMLVGNPRIRFSGNEAIVDLIWTGVLNESIQSPPRLLQQGTDHTVMIKVNGEWKITRRIITSLSNQPQAWTAR